MCLPLSVPWNSRVPCTRAFCRAHALSAAGTHQEGITCGENDSCVSGSGSVQARKCRENGNIMDEYRSLFKATSILMQTIPKHASYKEPRWQKLHTDLSKTLKDDVVRLEELKTLISSGKVTVLRTIKPGAVRVEASRMPSVDWALHTPTVAGSTHMPLHYFVNNPTVERIASQPAGVAAPVPATDPNDPFAASAAFNAISLTPWAPAPSPQSAGAPFTGVALHTLEMFSRLCCSCACTRCRHHECIASKRNRLQEPPRTTARRWPQVATHVVCAVLTSGCRIQVRQPCQIGYIPFNRELATTHSLPSIVSSGARRSALPQRCPLLHRVP